MREELVKTARTILGFSNRERLQVGVKYADIMCIGFKEEGKTEVFINKFFGQLLRLLTAADAEITKAERSYFNAVTGSQLSDRQFFMLTSSGDAPEFVDYMLSQLKQFSPKVRAAIIMFSICFITSDHEVSPDEIELLEKMME